MGLSDRLSRLEQLANPAPRPEIWVNAGDGLMRRGDRVVTEAEWRAEHPDADSFTLNIARAVEDPDVIG